MITAREPTTMTEAKRFAEIAEILAKGYLRLLLSRGSRQNCLDEGRLVEAPCGSKATNPESNESAA